jgi:hypothetical protein
MVEAAQKLTGQLQNSIGNYLINSITVSKLLIEYGLIEYDENKIPEDIKEKRKIGFELKSSIEDNENLASKEQPIRDSIGFKISNNKNKIF